MTDTPNPTGSPDPVETSQTPNETPVPDPLPQGSGLTKEEEASLADMSLMEISEGPASTDQETVIQAKVLQIHGDDVFIDVGGKSEGVVPKSQFSEEDNLEIGTTVEVVYDRFDSGSSLKVYSREGAAKIASWDTLRPGTIVEGRITGMNKGGLEIDLKGIRGFMPASQVDVIRETDISTFLNQTLRCQVMEADRRENNVLVSRRKLLEKERAEQRDQLMQELTPGQKRTGVIRSVMDYGAFVDLGGVDGLLHVSDMSYTHVNKPSDFVSVGQNVEVLILKVEKEGKKQRISLGMKQTKPDPWADVVDKYPMGTQMNVRIVRVADFGAFAEVEPGVDALIPVSEMSHTRINKPKDVVSVGNIVDAVVLRVDPQKRQMSLSMKDAMPDPWDGVSTDFAENSVVTGRVTKITDFGAFVELRPAVEGLIHISELANEHVRKVGDVVNPGDEVKVRVLEVNMDKRKISLSMKQADEPSADEAIAAMQAAEQRTKKKRKKPLRGGWGANDDGGMFDGLLS